MPDEGKKGTGMYLRLQIAYGLEFAIWGAWSYMLGTWASVHHIAQGSLYAMFALGALFAPLVGPVADRKFPAQKVLAFMQAVCGLALLACAFLASKEGRLAEIAFTKANDPTFLAKPSVLWQAMMFLAGFFFLPTIPLLNAIVFKHIPNSSKSNFVFVFGTIGWIVVNWILSAMKTTGVEYFYIVDAAIALGFALYALTLPNTPPSGSKNNDPFGLKALALFKRWDFAVFITCATLVGVFGSNYYFAFVGECFPGKGVFNQYSELFFMLALSFAVTRIGLKWVLTLGMLSWGVRYLLFATGNDCAAAVGILLHGLAYAFLYTAAYMFGDKVASKEQKASVQALIAFLLLGVAQTASGYLADWLKIPRPVKPEESVAVVVVQPALAQDESIAEGVAENVEPVDEAVATVADVVESAVATDASVAEVAESAVEADPVAVASTEPSAPKAEFSLKVWWDKGVWNKYWWEVTWGVPGVFCMIFAILFALAGKEPKSSEEKSEEESKNEESKAE